MQEKRDSKVKRAAKTNNQQVYERSIFPSVFEDTAQAAYIENMAADEQLFMDADKYRIIQKALAERLYQELHNQSKWFSHRVKERHLKNFIFQVPLFLNDTAQQFIYSASISFSVFPLLSFQVAGPLTL